MTPKAAFRYVGYAVSMDLMGNWGLHYLLGRMISLKQPNPPPVVKFRI